QKPITLAPVIGTEDHDPALIFNAFELSIHSFEQTLIGCHSLSRSVLLQSRRTLSSQAHPHLQKLRLRGGCGACVSPQAWHCTSRLSLRGNRFMQWPALREAGKIFPSASDRGGRLSLTR